MVLVHMPGKEVADNWGLNKKMDMEAMRREHARFQSLLVQNGIQVFEVTEVLAKLPVEKLRTLAQSLYDIDFTSMSRWELIDYMIVTPPLKGLYFTRDQSITTPRGTIVGKMTKAHRKSESDLIALCYEYLGGGCFYQVSGSDSRLEGGDYIPFGTIAFIGEGLRTNREGITELLNVDAFGHDTIVVVKDAVKDAIQMHLDTYFNVMDADLVSLSAVRLNAQTTDKEYAYIDIYTRPKGGRIYQLEKQNASLVAFLQQRGVHILPISEVDMKRFACNFICIAPRHIIMNDGQSASLRQSLESLKVKAEYIDLSELSEGCGCAHCMTQVLSRKH